MICAPLNPRLLKTSIIFLLTTTFITEVNSAEILKWTDLNCQVLEGGKNYVDFEYCYLKAVRRDYTELYMKVLFFQLPITNAVANLQMWKRANGYRPFLYNVRFDYCKLINNNKYHMSLEKFIFEIVRNGFKEPAACPWNSSSATMDHLGLKAEMFALPLPTGKYRIDSTFATDGIPRIVVNITILFKE